MDKAPEAFRTISEVAEAIAIPAHVLRFWETRFPQIKPVKRAGGRRYYRPSDVNLVAGIRQLLHIDGLSIREVQAVLRAQGVRHVAAIGGASPAALDLAAAQALEPVRAAPPPPQAQILPMDAQVRRPLGEAQTLLDPTQGADIRPLFAIDPAPASAPPASDASDPAPVVRKPRAANLRPVTAPPDQPALPLFATAEAPEAPHIWVEADGAPEVAVIPLPIAQAKPAQAAPASKALAQMTAQLQPLPAPATGQTNPALRALHDQLTQLHAKMAQAARQQS